MLSVLENEDDIKLFCDIYLQSRLNAAKKIFAEKYLHIAGDRDE